MKKTTNRTTNRPKLALQREVIAELTRLQLDKVAAGASICSWMEPNSCGHSNPQQDIDQ